MKHSIRTTLMCLALGLTGTGGAMAATGLQVQAQAAASSQGRFVFDIANNGAAMLSDVQMIGAGSYSVSCDTHTAAGRAFALEGSIDVGDRVRCTAIARPPLAGKRSIAVVVSAKDAHGQMQLGHASLGVLGGMSDQGVIVVAGGVVHNDTNLDGALTAGETLDYHYSLLNAGDSDLSAIVLSDIDGVVTCPQNTLAVGASFICTRSYTIVAGDQGAGFVLNEVEAIATSTGGQPVQASDVLFTPNFVGSAGIRVFKSPRLITDADGSGYASAGDVIGYTFVVKNSGAQSLAAVNLIEPDPSLIDAPITCSATTLSGAPFAGLGSGVLASMDVLLCSAQHTISAAEASAGEALNLVEASATATIGGAISGTGASTVAIPLAAQIQVSKTASISSTTRGSTIVYTVRVSNTSSVAVPNIAISDPEPAGVAFSWTCTATGMVCPNASGNGSIDETVTLFPAGGELVYHVEAAVAADAPANIRNVVTVTPDNEVFCAPAGTPSPCEATVDVFTGEPVGVPVDSRWLLIAMAIGLLLAARRALRSRPG